VGGRDSECLSADGVCLSRSACRCVCETGAGGSCIGEEGGGRGGG
jgi:hypothetical protein